MKRIVFLIFIIISSVCFSQDITRLNGFQYLHIIQPTYGSGRQTDIYRIAPKIREIFVDKGFGYISNPEKPIGRATKNPCLILYCHIKHEAPSDWTNAKLTLTFTNCYRRVVYKTSGKGGIASTYQKYFAQAVKSALRDFSRFNFQFDSSLTPQIVLPEVENTDETDSSLMAYYDSTILTELEGIYKSYKSESVGHYKIGIKKYGSLYKAIIIETEYDHWKTGEVKAIFEPTSMNGFYSVTWYMNNKKEYETFALLEDQVILSVEFDNLEEGEKKTSKFIKLYPSAENKSQSNESNSIAYTGSGFVISSNGIIGTNAHVVEGSSKIEISIYCESLKVDYLAEILLMDQVNDVALLKINDERFTGFPSIPYGFEQSINVGEDVFTIGFPLSSIMGDNYKVTNGIISSNSGIKNDLRYYQITTPIQPGNSGGPLFNSTGNIVGLTTARLNEEAAGTNVENVNFAIKINYMLNIYNMVQQKEPLSTNNTLKNKKLAEQVMILKKYVCLVKSYQ